jgi:tripartite-type tricarboxylate transporter receptor subunit TctC
VEKLNQMSNAAVSTPEVQSRLAALGVEVETLSSPQLLAKMTAEYERWGKVVKAAGMKLK